MININYNNDEIGLKTYTVVPADMPATCKSCMADSIISNSKHLFI